MSVGFEFNPNKQIWYGPVDEGPMPYVTFEDRAVEDRVASQRDGITRYKNVTFVRVMSAGSKDTFENVATVWLDYLDLKVSLGMYSPQWAEQFRRQYEQYLQQGHAEIVGTPIKMAAFLNAGEIESCLGANIFTLEGLVGCGEDGLKNIGMGARVLQQKAKAYLEQQEGGKIAQQMADIASQVAALKDVLDAKDETISALQAELAEMRRPRRRRETATAEEEAS